MACVLRFFFLSLLLLLPTFLKAEWGLGGYQSDLMNDLMIVECINQRLSKRFPVYYNNLLYYNPKEQSPRMNRTVVSLIHT